MLTLNDVKARLAALQGLSFQQIANEVGKEIPLQPQSRKGFIGMCVEQILGGSAGNKALPDFPHLLLELKTLPLNHLGKSKESTFITTIAPLTIHQETWTNSACYQKLKQILWVPIEDDAAIPFPHRRVGSSFFWSPNATEAAILQNDWQEITTLIAAGRIEEINATMGVYLQLRPKGQTNRSLCEAFDHIGNRIKTLPRGFYLRSLFTNTLLELR